MLSPRPCDSKTVNATWLENLVWQEIEKALRDPDLLVTYVRNQRESKDSPNHLEERIRLNKNMLKTYDEGETKYLRLYGAGVVKEDKLRDEVTRIRKEIERTTLENRNLEKQLSEIRDLETNIESVRQLCGLITQNLKSLTFDERRLALNALCVQVWIDGASIVIEGNLPSTTCMTASQQSRKKVNLVINPLLLPLLLPPDPPQQHF
jgi:hypothetical protein